MTHTLSFAMMICNYKTGALQTHIRDGYPYLFLVEQNVSNSHDLKFNILTQTLLTCNYFVLLGLY